MGSVSAGYINVGSLNVSNVAAAVIKAANFDIDNLKTTTREFGDHSSNVATTEFVQNAFGLTGVTGGNGWTDITTISNIAPVLSGYDRTISDAHFRVDYNISADKGYKVTYKGDASVGETVIATWDASNKTDLMTTLKSVGYNPSRSEWFSLFVFDPVGSIVGPYNSFAHYLTQLSLLAKDQVTGEYIPYLATALPTHSVDYKEWTFTVKSGIKYENGVTEVTAADFKYAVNRLFGPLAAYAGSATWVTLLNLGGNEYNGPYEDQTNFSYFDSAVVVADNQITFKFTDPIFHDDLCDIFSGSNTMPVPEALDTPGAVDSNGIRRYNNGGYELLPFNPFSCGPYKVTHFEHWGLLFEKNPYWDSTKDTVSKQQFDKIYMLVGVSLDLINRIYNKDIMPNASSFNRLYKTQQVGFYKPDVYKKYHPNNIKIEEDLYVSTLLLSNKRLNDINIRKAIFYGLNIQSYINFYGGDSFQRISDSYSSNVNIPDYAPTTGNIHDTNWVATGNTVYANTFMEILESTNHALWANVTSSETGKGIQMIGYDPIGTYDGFVTSLAKIGIKLNVTYTDKATALDEVSTNPLAYDIVSFVIGNTRMLDNLRSFADYRVGDFGNLFTTDGANYDSMITAIDNSRSASSQELKYQYTHDAAQICLDNCYAIFPIVEKGTAEFGSAITGPELDIDPFGNTYLKTRYI